MGSPAERSASPAAALRELAALFLRLGATAFGGPAAHIAMLEDEVVRRRRWLTHERFLDMLGATNVIPGPNSTEMAIHVGLDRAGLPGVVIAGMSFILPAALITLLIAWAYVRFGALPEASAFLYGAKAAIIAVVLQALWRLGRAALRSRPLVVTALVALAASALGVHELVVLFGAGGVLAAGEALKARLSDKRLPPTVATCLVPLGIAECAGTAAATFTLGGLFLFFLKVGAVLFGSGYVLLAFLRADLVERWHWLTNEQLLDAIAVGQITPGPVFTHRHLHRLPSRAHAGGVGRDRGHLPASLRFRRAHRAVSSTHPTIRNGGGVPRRRERRLAGAPRAGHWGTRVRRDRRLEDGWYCLRSDRSPRALWLELRLARPRRRRPRSPGRVGRYHRDSQSPQVDRRTGAPRGGGLLVIAPAIGVGWAAVRD